MKAVDVRNIDIDISGRSPLDIKKTGLLDLQNTFYDILCQKKYDTIKDNISNVFIEYSTVSSTLISNKLIGYACLSTVNDPIFNDNVRKYDVESIIKDVKRKGFSLYYHKDFISTKRASKYGFAGKPIISALHNFPANYTAFSNISIYTQNERANYDKSLYWSITYDLKYEELIDTLKEFENNTKFIEDLFGLMHLFYNRFFLRNIENANNINSIFFGVPTIGAIVEDSNLGGQGGIFVYFTYSKETDTAKITEFVNEISLQFDYTIKSYILNILSDVGLKLWLKSKHEAIKSAKAAIMSRNISHNLGSHVMAYLKHKLGSVSDIIKQRVLADLTYSDSLSDLAMRVKQYESDNAGFSESVELPFLVGLGHFLSYLQEREDYIATVATSYIPHLMSVNFKDAIYDMLNPDLRHLRHSSRKGGKPDNILLSYIAKSESFERPAYLNYTLEDDLEKFKALDQEKRDGDIVLKFGDFDGINDIEYVEYTPNPEYMSKGETSTISVRGEECDGVGYGAYSLDEMRKINIGLPGGVTGRQALFSILENIIRNSAKHGIYTSPEDRRLVLTMDIYDLEDSTTKEWLRRPQNILLYEFLGNKENNYLRSIDVSYTYVMTITDGALIEEEHFKKLVKALEYAYIDENGEMDGRAKGLKEMRISAAWLRRIADDSEEYIKKKNLSPIIRARFTNSKKDSNGRTVGNLQYVICLPKAFAAAVIMNKDFTSTNDIKYLKVDKIEDLKTRSFDIIAIEESMRDQLYLKTPNRVISMSENDIKEFETLTEDARIDYLYKKRISNNGDKIYIFDKSEHFQTDRKKDQKVVDALESASDNDLYIKKYLYKHHLESEGEFKQFVKQLLSAQRQGDQLPRPLFAEGISGGNSTDRIVRNDIHDSRWYYKHLHAMQCKVAIFDERLFHNNTGLSDEDLCVDDTINGDYLAVVNAFKNVYVFNVLYNLACDCFDVFGYDSYILTDEVVHSRIKKVGEIKYVQDELLIEIDSRYRNQFDNLSIHQGLLDKIYRKWGLEAVENKDNNCPKYDFSRQEMATKKLYDTILRMNKEGDDMISKMVQLDYTDKDSRTIKRWFYPNMTIHSGRSKPSELDMPQLMPFIQYASIENALMDCKYSLVELLELSQYE